MKRMNRLWALLAAAAALSTSLASNASASTFLSHPTGKLLGEGGLLLVSEAFCRITLVTEGATTLLSSKTLLVTVKGKLCQFLGSPATIDTLKYSLDANGSAKLLNTPIILGMACKITIPSSKNQTLKTLKFDKNVNGTLLVLWKVRNLVASGESILCNFPESEVFLENEVQIGVQGGTLRWDA